MNKKKKVLAVIITGIFLSSCSNSPSNKITVSNNIDDRIESRVDSLLPLLSIDEKIGQINQIASVNSLEEMSDEIKKGNIGSILNETDAERINTLQKVAIEQSPHHIPLLMGRDVIHGYKTIMPIPIGQAASFDPEIAKEGARVAAEESSSVGIRWTFSPMVDISRDARWGRLAEGYGEDVYLSSQMAYATVKGYQTDNLSNPTTMAACVKHFCGYGASESGKDYNSTFIPERLLRNVYLPSFKAAVDAGAFTLMTSFNDNNGIPASGNAHLLNDILKTEWNFRGFVVTDYGTITEMVTHGFKKDKLHAGVDAIESGVDMEMASKVLITEGWEKLHAAGLNEKTVDNAVRRILRVKFKLGLFDNPYVDTSKKSVLYSPAHLAVAKKAALESAILLKNDGVLPLKKSVKRVLVVGPLADAPHEQLGTWTFDGEDDHSVTPLTALKEKYGNRIKFDFLPTLKYSRDRNTKDIAKAVAAARRADVVMAFVGEEAILTGESHSMADISLVGAQSELIESLSKINTPLVTIIMAGRPLTIQKEVEESDAVMFSFHPGTMGGPALAELIMGDAVPSGRVPMTFPRMVGQSPIYYAHHNTGRPSNGHETLLYDIPVHMPQTSSGFRSYFLDAGETPLFCFGYGLSYTTFKYGSVSLKSDKLSKSDTIMASVTLSNTGEYDATEVVQMYVRDCVGSITRPVKELRRFSRIKLKAGETRVVSFELPVSELAFWTRSMKHEVENGKFEVWISKDSDSGIPVSFTVE